MYVKQRQAAKFVHPNIKKVYKKILIPILKNMLNRVKFLGPTPKSNPERKSR